MADDQEELWSGLETPGMREAKCSLLLPRDITYDARILSLLPDGSFQGATILQLEPTMIESNSNSVMPITITMGGRVVMTPENYDDFRVMMRTKQQSEEMGMAVNGTFEWPDVNALLLCPCCGNTGPIPHRGDKQEHEYWLVFYPLLQIAVLNGSQMTLGTRTMCRLVCLECMEDMIEGLFLEVTPGRERGGGLSFTLPVSNVLAEAGSASFLEDGPSRPESHPHVDDILDAWTLYNLWEHAGAWQALQNSYRQALSRSITSSQQGGQAETSDATESKLEDERVSLKHRIGMECGNPDCTKIHGHIFDGQVCRLYIKCSDCHSELYCSRECRDEAKVSHRLICLDRRRQREEKRDKKTRKVECLSCGRKFPCTKMKKCSSCRVATYCSVDCQRKDWAQHKFICKK